MRQVAIRMTVIAAAALLAPLIAASPAGAAQGCTGATASTAARLVVPFGGTIVGPTASGPGNFGQTVIRPEATAPHDACPVGP
jgi:hypothetical protein